MYINTRIGNEFFVALVDTGASGFAFVSTHFGDRLSLTPQPLNSAIAILGFEGKISSKVTSQVKFPLILGNYEKDINAYVISNCKHDLVRGLPWLEKYCPYVNWKDHTITFSEPCLESSCCLFETTIPYHNTTLQAFESGKNNKVKIDRLHRILRTECYPRRIPAAEFAMISEQPSSETLALSIRDLDIMLEGDMQRLPNLHVGNATTVIPRDANPKDFLPLQYHDFLDVFDRKQANSLPPHRPWDHVIDLQSGKQPSVARPYSMNMHKLKTLRECLEKELSKGFIQVCRSPAAAPVLFVKRSNGDL
ncbi:hypothetical protein K3495_g267 [Podosphaera aphanis]|nr:hypothetical protein K3495_g267 [Podosphaera aphanis]